MKILILHQYFNTPAVGGPLRSYYLAKALLSRGHQVSVITSTNAGHRRVENIEGIQVHYLPIAYDNSFGFYKRGRSFIQFVAGACQASSKISNIELTYAISVPITVGICAMWLKRFRRIPFIFEVGDLWPDAPIELGFVKNPLLKSLLYTLEKKIYRGAQ